MWSRVLWEWMRWDRAAVRLGLGLGDRVALRDRVGLRERTRLARAVQDLAVPNPGVPNPGAAEPRGAEPRVVEPRRAEPGSAEARIAEPQGLRTRGRRNQGAEPRGTEPTTPWPATARAALSCPNPGDTELVSAERRRCRTRRGRTSRGGPSLRVDGPCGAGRVVVGTSRCAAAEAQPRRRARPGQIDRHPAPRTRVSRGTPCRRSGAHRCPTDRPRRAAVAPAVSAVRDLGDRPDAPASHETGSRSSSFWSGTGRGAHLNRSSPRSRRAGIEGTAAV